MTSVPNLGLLEHPGSLVNGHVNPSYVSQPAPLGLTDYGLGATTYSYNTSRLMGQVTFNAPPNATQPGATGVIEPAPIAQHLGEVGSPYEFGIQLNTISTNLSIPGAGSNSFFWTQNVVNWNDTGIHFVDDTFNFTAGSGLYLAPNTILSGCHTNAAGVDLILYVYGGVFQCVGGTIPVSPASYPVTLQLYNNASTTAQNDSQITYGYRIIEAGTGNIYTGISDTIVFNNTNAAVTPPHGYVAPPPGYTVDGFAYTPTGFLRDAELDIVGGIGGDNAVFRSLNGSVNLMYWNSSSGGWQNVPSAYNWGGDTGETSAGIADFWTPSHTLEINQGPAMLYGLWNAEPQVSVKSGDVEIGGSVNPSYAFVFVSNTPPVVNAFASGARDNLSLLPTTDSGTFNTYLPPFGGAWTSTYYVQAFADGSAEYNGTVTASTNTYAITMTHAQGLLRAPLYAYTNAQIAALSFNVTGGTAAPWKFVDLDVNVNSTFAHVNDFDYPEFEVFWAQGVTQVINVTFTYQGDDSSAGNFYIYDSSAGYPTGVLVPGPRLAFSGGSVPLYTSEINVFGGRDDQFYSSIYVATDYGGGANVILWHDTGAVANESLIGDGGFIWIGDSVATQVNNSVIIDTDGGIVDIGSTQTSTWDTEVDDALGINAYSSHDATYAWTNVTDGGEGILAGADFGLPYYYSLPGTYGLTVTELSVTFGSAGANLTYSNQSKLTDVYANDPVDEDSIGLILDNTFGTTVNTLDANYSVAIYTWNATTTAITNLLIQFGGEFDFQSEFYYSTTIVLTGVTIYEPEWIGIFGEGDTGVTVANANVTDAFGGVVFEYVSGFTGTNLNSSYGEFSYELDYAMPGAITVTGVNAYDSYIGFNLYYSSPFTVTNVFVGDSGTTNYAAGVEIYGAVGGSVSAVNATDESVGVRLSGDSTGVSVTMVSATDESIGVYVDPSAGIISGVVATDDSLGVDLSDSANVTISGTTVSDFSVGDRIYDSTDVTDTGATVSGGNSTGVFVEDSSFVTVSGTTATNTVLNPFYGYEDYLDLPFAAVVTEGTYGTIIAGVTATNYWYGLIDDESYGLQVSNLNATGGEFGIYFEDTWSSYVNGVGAYKDYVGLVMADEAEDNTVTGSSFVDDTSFGVSILYGYDNTVYMNNFIGDNGATSTYSSAHIQAQAAGYNSFSFCTNYDCTTGVGNYWSDWHTYSSDGSLAPYFVGGETWDYFPTGAPETFAVNFVATGLAAGESWSVTLNGVTETATTATISFSEPMGTYAYQVGNVAGYTVTPSSGSVVLGAATYNVSVTFSVVTYAVTLSAGGLSTGTTWSATVNGVTQSTAGTSLVWYLASGTYTYKFLNVSGYNLPSTGASGSVAVASAPTSLSVSYSPTSTPSYVSTDTFNTWLAVAFAIAVIALVIALLAVMMRGRREKQATAQPAQAWTPPPAGSTGGAGGTTGNWSEGPPPAGGSPPS